MARPRARRGLVVAVILLGSVSSRPLRAQLDGYMDAGGARLRQIGIPQTDVLTLGARLRWQGVRSSLLSSGAAANAANGAWTAQGLLSGSLYAPPLQPRRWEIGGALGAFGASATEVTTSGQLLFRQHFLAGSRAGVFVGAQGGGTVRAGAWRHAAALQAGAWRRTPRIVLSAALSMTDTKSELLVQVPPGAPGAPYGIYREQHPATYLDAFAFWQHARERVELEAGGGVRAGVRGMERGAVWGSASATFWLLPRLGVVASTGRALEDVVRGLPQTRYLSLSLRVGLGARVRASAPRLRSDDSAPRLAVQREDGGAVVILVRVAEAERVEIMGDFTAWEPVPLTLAEGAWSIRREMHAGSHRVALRIDGGAWSAPVNLPKITDDFGGTVGLLSVP